MKKAYVNAVNIYITFPTIYYIVGKVFAQLQYIYAIKILFF